MATATATATPTSSKTKLIAVVTGGNKGIGFEICKQLASNGISLVLTARDAKRGNDAVQKLRSFGLCDIVFHQLDVTNAASVSSLAGFIETSYGKLDILVNNAGIVGSVTNTEDPGRLRAIKLDMDEAAFASSPALKEFVYQTVESAENCLRTNYYGSKQVAKALIPLLQLSNSARIVNVSSSMGQLKLIPNERVRRVLGDIDGLTEEKVDKIVEEFLGDVKESLVESKGWPINYSAYIVSKATLNAFTRILAKKYTTIVISSVNPGYTSTDLNHKSGVLSVEEGAKGPVMLALRDGGSSGLYYDRMEVSSF
ncbi:(+)-neomenthol dehydrogenase-like [Mangifera indica]|uniref:(+)-neomenthol dehydrogenase-like n=1 Tax=Mangifera indica TaxID=29780 RepID=UPI001CF94103|nr:(+)-neomenthol dehydrogenase-like [Mangifera indica]